MKNTKTTKQSIVTLPHACKEIENRATLFLLARGMDRGRVRPITTTTPCDMAVMYSNFDEVCPSKRKSVCDNTVLWVVADLHGASAVGKGKHEYTCLCCFLLSL